MAAAAGSFVKAVSTSATSVTTTAITSSAGDALFSLCSSIGTGADPTFSDSKSNTFSAVGTTQTAGGGVRLLTAGVTAAPSTGASHTGTVTFGTANNIVLLFGNISGAAQSACFDSASVGQAADAATPFTVTSGTPTQSDNLWLTGFSLDAGATAVYTEGTGFSTLIDEPNNGSYRGCALAAKAVVSASGLTPSWTCDLGTTETLVRVVAVKSAAASVGGSYGIRGPKFRGFGFATGTTEVSAVTAYELSIDPESYALSAADQTLTVDRSISIDPASYTLTAANETLSAGRTLSVDPASYALTAAAETLSVGRALSFNPVSYTITAAPVTLTTARSLSIDPASYVLTTAPVTFSTTLGLSIAPAAYALTAEPVSFVATRALSIDPAAYALTAPAVTLAVGQVLSVDAATYTLTASEQTLTTDRVLDIEPAAYALTAAPVDLTYGAAGPVLSIDPVAYLLSLADVTFEIGGGAGPGVGAGNFGFEIVTRERRIREVQFKPLLARVLEAKAAQHVRPVKERARKRAKAIEVQAAHLVLDDGSQARFDTLLAQWLAQRPVMPPAADPLAVFLAQIAFRLEQLGALQQAAAALAAMAEQDDEDALLALLLA